MSQKQSTIQGKLMGVIMLTSGTILLMACAAFFGFEYYSSHDLKKRQISTLGEIVAANCTASLAFNNKTDAEEILNALKAEKNISGACLYDIKGNVFAVYPAYFIPGKRPALPGKKNYYFDSDYLEGFQPVIQGDAQLGLLYLKADMKDMYTRFLLYGGIALLFTMISFITAYLFSKYLQKAITSPILELADAARTVSEKQDYSVRTVKRTDDEVGDLTEAFNLMLTQIERQNGEIHTLNHNLELKVKERTSELEYAYTILKQQTELVENVINSSVDLIAVLDTDLRYRVINKSSEAAYGENYELIGKKIDEVFPRVKISGMMDALQQALKGETVKIAQYRSEVTTRLYEQFYIPIKDKDDKVYLVLTIAHDITDIMEANEKLQLLNKELAKSNEELEQFAYVASHDLQEPLRKIQTFSELSLKHIDNRTVLSSYLQKINVSGFRMKELIKAVLNYSRLSKDAEQFANVDLNKSVENIFADLELLITEKHASIKKDDLPVIRGIPQQISQLFLNLTTNALKFSDKAPEIIISCEILKGKRLGVEWPGLKKEGDYVRIVYSDNGIGFENRFADKIFSIFQRLHKEKKFEGTGIGLAVCKRIVENHEGFISVQSEPGKGTSFYIYLPQNKSATLMATVTV